MPQNSKSKKKPTTTKLSKLHSFALSLKERSNAYLARRPHRSFKLTKRRDYKRPLKLPSYFAFNNYVNKMLLANKGIFIWLGIVYAVLYGLLIGVGSQETYDSLSQLMAEAGTEILGGDIAQFGQAGLIFMVAASTGLTASLSEAQQIYGVLLIFLVWLTTVWLLRNRMAGHKVILRDGLYNAGSPIVSTLLVAGLLVLQMIPIGIAAVGYSLANNAGLLNGGVATMLFWVAAGLLGVLSLYWATSTLIALVIVTLPGIYPLKAIKTAGDLVIGRRMRILLRWLWMMLSIVIVWAIILIPFILIDMWVKNLLPAISWVPFVPLMVLALSTFTVIWTSAYVYLLYRKVVDDDAS